MSALEAPSFDEHIGNIVESFLQTVVVVDDQALTSREGVEPASEEEQPGEAVGRGRGVRSGLRPPAEPDDHDLDPKAVTDAFAQHGLVCSLLSPDPGEDIDEMFLRAARRADLVLLDWVLHRDEGRKTLKLVEKILEDDEHPARRRLRTIVIYTGQPDLHDVAEKLAQTIDGAYGDCELELHDDGLTMTKGPVRAAVFAKQYVRELGKDLESRRIAIPDLPARLRSEFATLTTGLITAVALASLSALREDTHRVLKTLGPRLDPAYLGHRAALADPEEAEGQVVALVAAEIRSVIEDNHVERNVELPVLSLWLANARQDDLHFGELIDSNKRLSLPQVEAILTRGLGSEEGLEALADAGCSKSYLKKVKPQATKVFSATVEEAAESDADFAHRMMMRTLYSAQQRILQLGTIVRSDDGYRLCVQPLCDSVRLTGSRRFPFLPLSVVDAGEKADFVVVDEQGAGWIYLRLGGNPSDLLMLSFDPGASPSVIAAVDDDLHSFTDSAGATHRWVGELKPDFAQRAAFELAQQFGRIAVDEAEFFRLSRR
jgi:Response receiver domain